MPSGEYGDQGWPRRTSQSHSSLSPQPEQINRIRDNLLPVCRKVTEPAGILAVGNSAAPVIDHDHIVFLDFHLPRPFCLWTAPVPSPLLSINIADRHTSKQVNRTLHTSCISCTKKGHPPGCPSFPYPRSIYLPTASVYPPCAILRPLGFFLTNPASLRSR